VSSPDDEWLLVSDDAALTQLCVAAFGGADALQAAAAAGSAASRSVGCATRSGARWRLERHLASTRLRCCARAIQLRSAAKPSRSLQGHRL
jgi:hypothetical protein